MSAASGMVAAPHPATGGGGEVAYVVGESDPAGSGVRPLAAFRTREAAERWALKWLQEEVAASRLASGYDSTEIRAVPLDPISPVAPVLEGARASHDAPSDAPVRTDRPDLLDEEALPFDGLAEPERTEALERLARDVLGEHAAAWWGTPSRETWDAAPRALLSSDVGARRVRKVLLSALRGLHGVYE